MIMIKHRSIEALMAQRQIRSQTALAKMAGIVPGVAIFSFFGLIVVLAAATVSLDPHELWHRWEKLR